MTDLTNPRVIKLKGLLFFLLANFAAALLLIEAPSVRVAVLLAITVWGFCRSYYFAFYVIEHYVDPGYKFAGLWHFVKYLRKRRGQGRKGRSGA